MHTCVMLANLGALGLRPNGYGTHGVWAIMLATVIIISELFVVIMDSIIIIE